MSNGQDCDTAVAVRGAMIPLGDWCRRELVRSEVVSLGQEGPIRLTVFHARGRIVEYFPDTAAALQRQSELERLLAAVQG